MPGKPVITGTSNRILEVDLSAGTSAEFRVPEQDRRLYLGGKGLGLKLLYDRMNPGLDPLGPDNILAVMTGVMMGTGAPCSGKFVGVTKSPLTGIMVSSSCGGPFGMALKTSGWDGLLLKGKAKSPTVLAIDSRGVEFLPGGHLLGLDTAQTQIKSKSLGHGALAIGPAGENLVPYACAVSGHRVFGRGGLGAVLGSKNVKAVAARGNEFEVAPVEADAFAAFRKKGNAYIDRNAVSGNLYRRFGTNANVLLNDRFGLLPVHNFRGGYHPDARLISGERLAEKHMSGHRICRPCSILCGHKGTFHGASRSVPEYETMGMFGANLGVFDPEIVSDWNETCTLMGLDTISTAGTIAWAMEAAEKGLFPSDLRFGRPDGIAETLLAIASRTGIGNELAMGSRRLSEKYGGAEFAIQVKGLEMAAYDPRGAWGQGLSFAVANRGACHLSSAMFAPETFLEMIPPQTCRGKAFMVKFLEDTLAAVNSMHLCLFTAFPFELEPFLVRVMPRFILKPFMATLTSVGARLMDISLWPELYRTVLGRRLGSAGFLAAGARIHVLERYMNTREGIRRRDDTLPARFLTEGRASDPKKATVPLEKMLDRYYRLRGYDRDGVPTDLTLARHGIEKK